MVKQEFNLSEKIELVEREDDVGETEVILKRNIKEFIEKLKEELLDYQYQTNPQLNEYCHKNIIKQIDKLAGEDLI